MARKFDVELLLDTIIGILQNNLSAKITALNTEFIGDGNNITLVAVPSANILFNSIKADANINPWIIVRAEGPIEVESMGVILKHKVAVRILYGDSGLMNNDVEIIERTLFRHVRAISETIVEKFDNRMDFTLLTITEIPSNLSDEESGELVITNPGIELVATYA